MVMAILMVAPPSKDFPLLAGLSRTRKDDESGGLSTSSKALPDDFRRWNPLSLIGMKVAVSGDDDD